MPLHAEFINTPLKTRNGFSLIEVMIALAIIGILTSIAYPAYTEHVTNSRRADGQLALMEGAQRMERCKATNYAYTSCALASTTSQESHYNMTVTSDATTYTITATATGHQADDTDCSAMTLNHQGVRTPATGCWPQ